jgi:hypothetical protein
MNVCLSFYAKTPNRVPGVSYKNVPPIQQQHQLILFLANFSTWEHSHARHVL